MPAKRHWTAKQAFRRQVRLLPGTAVRKRSPWSCLIQEEVRRCFVNDLKQLPRRIVFSVEQKRDRDQQTGNVKGAPAKVAACLEQLSPSVSVSLRDVTDPELAQHPITFEATIDVSVRTIP